MLYSRSLKGIWIGHRSDVSVRDGGTMDHSAYAFLELSNQASPQDIMHRCQARVRDWTLPAVSAALTVERGAADAAVNAPRVWQTGQAYLQHIALMLLDPSARQCYDAWLDACQAPTPEKCLLTKARLQWFNTTAQSSGIVFDKSMVDRLNIEAPAKQSAISTETACTKPICRGCRKPFSFDEPYAVLHCHCTTRVGHVGCMDAFYNKATSKKCPVCRQKLLRRHQVSKYLFWNVKNKYKFIA